MLASLRFFLLGMWEFRRSCTTNPGEYIIAYDSGRNFAHELTFRYFDR